MTTLHLSFLTGCVVDTTCTFNPYLTVVTSPPTPPHPTPPHPNAHPFPVFLHSSALLTIVVHAEAFLINL